MIPVFDDRGVGLGCDFLACKAVAESCLSFSTLQLDGGLLKRSWKDLVIPSPVLGLDLDGAADNPVEGLDIIDLDMTAFDAELELLDAPFKARGGVVVAVVAVVVGGVLVDGLTIFDFGELALLWPTFDLAEDANDVRPLAEEPRLVAAGGCLATPDILCVRARRTLASKRDLIYI